MQTNPAIRWRSDREQSGNISVVTIGFLVIIGLLVVVVVNTSAAFLAHRQLANLADSIALGAADVVNVDYYLSQTSNDRVQIDEFVAIAEAKSRLDPEVSLHLRVMGDEVFVRLERPVDLWLVPGMKAQSSVAAESRATITVLNPS